MQEFIEKFINVYLPIMAMFFFFIGGMVAIWVNTNMGAKLGLTGFALLLLWFCCGTDKGDAECRNL